MDQLTQMLSQLGIDNTFYYQFVLVIILFPISCFVLFNKLLFVIENREEKTTKLESQADGKFEKVKELEEKYNERLEEAYSQAQQNLNTSKNKIIEEQTGIFKDEEKKINEYLDKTIDEERTKVLNQKDEILWIKQ